MKLFNIHREVVRAQTCVIAAENEFEALKIVSEGVVWKDAECYVTAKPIVTGSEDAPPTLFQDGQVLDDNQIESSF